MITVVIIDDHLAQGLDNTAITATLCLTTRTVQNHVSNILGLTQTRLFFTAEAAEDAEKP